MAAFISFKSGLSYEMHVGTGKAHKHNWRDVVCIQCDGDELELACKITQRKVEFQVFTFILEEAQLICVNWK